MTCITFFQVGHNFSEGGATESKQVARPVFFFHILLTEAKYIEFNICTPIFSFANRIGISDKVSLIAVAKDQAVNIDLLFPIDVGICRTCELSGNRRGCAIVYGKIKTFEEFFHFRIYRIRILQKILVNIFNKGWRGISYIREVLHILLLFSAILREANIVQNLQYSIYLIMNILCLKWM